MKIFIFLLGILISSLCMGQNFNSEDKQKYKDLYTPDLNALEESEKAWRKKRIRRYSYTIIKGGVFFIREYRVFINYGSCTAKVKIEKNKWEPVNCSGLSINELYNLVREDLSSGPVKFTLKYNKTFHFIQSFSCLPMESKVEDEGWYFKIEKFRVIRN